jgi:hypothetical protein
MPSAAFAHAIPGCYIFHMSTLPLRPIYMTVDSHARELHDDFRLRLR